MLYSFVFHCDFSNPDRITIICPICDARNRSYDGLKLLEKRRAGQRFQVPKSMENISDLRLFNHSEVLCYGPRFSSSNDFNRACILIGVKKNIVPLLGRYSIGIQVAFISIGQPTFNIFSTPTAIVFFFATIGIAPIVNIIHCFRLVVPLGQYFGGRYNTDWYLIVASFV